MKTLRFSTSAVLACLLAAAGAHADAIVRTQAMFATTIAEYFVEPDGIRVELEIGMADIDAFANLLPDEIYEKLGHGADPLAQRLPRFFAEDLVVTADDGAALPGAIVKIGPRKRVRRDEITGEPLVDDDAAEEIVVFATLRYDLAARPETLTLARPRRGKAATIGFVIYHRGVAVNDFRYLAPEQTLDLDWTDPWYSSFRSRSLRRSYFAPMSGFIYVDPYEVRKEIVARPLDLQRWVDLGLDGRETIPVEMQDEIKRKVGEFLRDRHELRVDGEATAPDLARIDFLDRTLTTSRVIDPPRELDMYSAILGAIFVYPTAGLPQRVTMDWDLWDERITQVPAASVDQAGPLPVVLEPDFRVLEWQNFLTNPVVPSLTVIASPPGLTARVLLYARWAMLVAAIAAILVAARSLRAGAGGRSRPVAVALVGSIVTAAAFTLSLDAALSDERAETVVVGLLHNIYRAFDFRDEERIYDTLARSVDGDLLTEVYLETRRGLELASQGGARARVNEVELLTLAMERSGSGGFVATATWNAAGSVGHWGHVHRRANQYEAKLDIRPVDGEWKLTGLEILEEQRL